VELRQKKKYFDGENHVAALTLKTYKGVDSILPHEVLGECFQGDLSFAPAVFSSCALIPCTHFEASLLRIGCYGYTPPSLYQGGGVTLLARPWVKIKDLTENCPGQTKFEVKM